MLPTSCLRMASRYGYSSLVKQHTQSSEVSLDSKFFLIAGEVAVKKAAGLKFESTSFDLQDFLTRIHTKLHPSAPSHDADESSDLIATTRLNWDDLSNTVEMYSQRAPTTHFM